MPEPEIATKTPSSETIDYRKIDGEWYCFGEKLSEVNKNEPPEYLAQLTQALEALESGNASQTLVFSDKYSLVNNFKKDSSGRIINEAFSGDTGILTELSLQNHNSLLTNGILAVSFEQIPQKRIQEVASHKGLSVQFYSIEIPSDATLPTINRQQELSPPQQSINEGTTQTAKREITKSTKEIAIPEKESKPEIKEKNISNLNANDTPESIATSEIKTSGQAKKESETKYLEKPEKEVVPVASKESPNFQALESRQILITPESLTAANSKDKSELQIEPTNPKSKIQPTTLSIEDTSPSLQIKTTVMLPNETIARQDLSSNDTETPKILNAVPPTNQHINFNEALPLVFELKASDPLIEFKTIITPQASVVSPLASSQELPAKIISEVADLKVPATELLRTKEPEFISPQIIPLRTTTSLFDLPSEKATPLNLAKDPSEGEPPPSNKKERQLLEKVKSEQLPIDSDLKQLVEVVVTQSILPTTSLINARDAQVNNQTDADPLASNSRPEIIRRAEVVPESNSQQLLDQISTVLPTTANLTLEKENHLPDNPENDLPQGKDSLVINSLQEIQRQEEILPDLNSKQFLELSTTQLSTTANPTLEKENHLPDNPENGLRQGNDSLVINSLQEIHRQEEILPDLNSKHLLELSTTQLSTTANLAFEKGEQLPDSIKSQSNQVITIVDSELATRLTTISSEGDLIIEVASEEFLPNLAKALATLINLPETDIPIEAQIAKQNLILLIESCPDPKITEDGLQDAERILEFLESCPKKLLMELITEIKDSLDTNKTKEITDFKEEDLEIITKTIYQRILETTSGLASPEASIRGTPLAISEAELLLAPKRLSTEPKLEELILKLELLLVEEPVLKKLLTAELAGEDLIQILEKIILKDLELTLNKPLAPLKELDILLQTILLLNKISVSEIIIPNSPTQIDNPQPRVEILALLGDLQDLKRILADKLDLLSALEPLRDKSKTEIFKITQQILNYEISDLQDLILADNKIEAELTPRALTEIRLMRIIKVNFLRVFTSQKSWEDEQLLFFMQILMQMNIAEVALEDEIDREGRPLLTNQKLTGIKKICYSYFAKKLLLKKQTPKNSSKERLPNKDSLAKHLV